MINPNAAPYLADRGIKLTVPFTYNGHDGVLIAQGGASNGFSLWIKEHVVHWTVTRNDTSSTVTAKDKLKSGQATLVVQQNKTGNVILYLNGSEIATGIVGGAFPSQPFDSLSVGQDSGSLVGPYETDMRYTDQVGPVEIQLLK